MSTDKLNRITAIASRQPAINPARHHVSPAVLEFRLLQMTQERDQLAAALALCAEDSAGRDELERDLIANLNRCANECERAGNAIGRANSPLVAGCLLDSAKEARALLARISDRLV